ncbi:hypothetical protein [uncultured Clostridium sp.]|uniref:hypothetical protein n=1 Tax=uncultured Clostridium sp. TaxID=59620 RepID=UPI0025FCF55B|nr:hypothetical protein [uncultured Clostridium sp.]
MNLQPIYIKGEEVDLSEAEQNLSEEEFNELLYKCKGVAYYYSDEKRYSHRKAVPLLVDKETGEKGCFI